MTADGRPVPVKTNRPIPKDKIFECMDIINSLNLTAPLKIGDTVIIADIGNEATVVTLKDKKGLVTVQMGTMKTRVKEENLRLIEEKER